MFVIRYKIRTKDRPVASDEVQFRSRRAWWIGRYRRHVEVGASPFKKSQTGERRGPSVRHLKKLKGQWLYVEKNMYLGGGNSNILLMFIPKFGVSWFNLTFAYFSEWVGGKPPTRLLFMYFWRWMFFSFLFFSEVCVEVFLRFLQVRYSWDIDHTVIEIYYTTQLATHPFSCWGQMYWLGWCETESCPFTKKTYPYLRHSMGAGLFMYLHLSPKLLSFVGK